MPAPIVWAGMALLGIWGTGWTLKNADEAFEDGAKMMKWAAIGGGVLVSYKALQSAGVLK